MTPEPAPAASTLKTIFGRALEIAAPDRRAAFLDGACGSHAALRAEVEALLAAFDRAGAFLGRADRAAPPDPDATASAADPPHPAPLVAGRYKLLEAIGEGGMGTVHVAEQVHPVRRKVALKLIKTGMDSKQVLARFEAERQALALMDHPNIARVLDAGLADDGRPFFAMEYLRGVPITTYCDQARLTVRQRLELFVAVCQAVQHAHQKGIIHRDLKPSNVLVALYDDRPVPKVIDFGLAKAIHGSLTEHPLHTAHEAVLGTPLYMAPEQAILNNIDVDTRADVYALGVLLYELLTGTTPLDRERFRKAAWDESLRLIREAEPSKPSTKLSTLAALPSVAASRQIEPARLSTLVRGDLDWIAMKALEKDRTRRYETPNALARDVERFLRDDPVEAGPPSTAYRLRKYARKHRAALTTAAAFALLLMSATAVSGVLATLAVRSSRRAAEEATRARQAGALAQSRLAEVETANAATLEALAEAERSRDQAKAVSAFLVESFRKPDPAQDGRELKVADLLDQAAAKLGDGFDGPPETRADLLNAIGQTYRGLGLTGRAIDAHARAAEVIEGALGPEHPTALTFRDNLATVYADAGRLAEAIALHERSYRAFLAARGPDHLDTRLCRNNLAAAYIRAGRPTEAIALIEPMAPGLAADPSRIESNQLAAAYLLVGRFREATALYEASLRRTEAGLGPDHPATFPVRSNLIGAYHAAGRFREAIAMGEALLPSEEARLGPDHPETLLARISLAHTYTAAGRAPEAVALLEPTAATAAATLGPDHPTTLSARHHLASAYRAVGRGADAIPLDEGALRASEATLGPDHFQSLSLRNNLAHGYDAAGRSPEAIAMFEDLLRRREATLGPDHRDTLTTRNNLGVAYQRAGRAEEARALIEEALRGREAALGPDHRDTLTTRNNLAAALVDLRRLDEALALYEETLRRRVAALGPDHPETLASRNDLAETYRKAGRPAEAAALLEEVVRLRRARLGPDHPDTLVSRVNLAAACRDAGRLEDAIGEWRDLLERPESADLAGRPETAAAMRRDLALALETLGRWAEAEPLRRGRLDRARGHPEAERAGLDGESASLGRNLVHQEKWADAEPVLRDCLSIREAAKPDDWATFHARSLLGACRLGRGEHAEAETLLIAGYEGMKAREDRIPAAARGRLDGAAARVLALYESWGRPEEAAEWRAKLAGGLPPP